MMNSGSGTSVTILDRLQVVEKRLAENDANRAVNYDAIYHRLHELESLMGIGAPGVAPGNPVATIGAFTTGTRDSGPSPHHYDLSIGLETNPVLEAISGTLREICVALERQSQDLSRLGFLVTKGATGEVDVAKVNPDAKRVRK